MAVDVLLGLQWGDEGKGKVVDVLGPQYDIVARFQGGPNAGHTIVIEGVKHVLHQIPSGIFHAQSICLIGNGVVLNPVILQSELKSLREAGVDVAGRLLLSRRMHLILPTHRLLDKAQEIDKGAAKIGSTLRGIGPVYQDKMARMGIRLGEVHLADFDERYAAVRKQHLRMLTMYGLSEADFEADLKEWEELFFASLPELRGLTLVDSEYYLNQAASEGKRILAEGAQGTLLDIDFGSYPFVTSSNTTVGGAINGLGVPPQHFGSVFGVFKAYCTRVGSGPFPTEIEGAEAERLRQAGSEFGATTGRPRRIGWIDLPALKYACMLNGVTELVMTKADVLSGMDVINVCTAYEIDGELTERMPFTAEAKVVPVYAQVPGWTLVPDSDRFDRLPEALQKYIELIEQALEVPVRYVSLGPDRKYIVEKPVAQPNVLF
jgi:adenylosuccinate synthase